MSSANTTYITYVHFGIYSTSLLCELSALCTMGWLLYSAHLRTSNLCVKELSTAVRFYLFGHICCSVPSLPFLIYKVLWWRPPSLRPADTPLYNVYTFFYTGCLYAAYYAASGIFVFVLCFDRCLVLKQFAHHWVEVLRKRWLIPASVATTAVVYLGCAVGFYFELPLQLDKVQFCESQSCMQARVKNFPVLLIKSCFGVFNVCCCAFFLRLLAKVKSQPNLDNRIIKITVFLEIFFGVIPGYTYIVYKFLTAVPLSNYTGELSYLFVSTDAAICGCFYWLKFRANASTGIAQMNIVRTNKESSKPNKNSRIVGPR